MSRGDFEIERSAIEAEPLVDQDSKEARSLVGWMQVLHSGGLKATSPNKNSLTGIQIGKPFVGHQSPPEAFFIGEQEPTWLWQHIVNGLFVRVDGVCDSKVSLIAIVRFIGIELVVKDGI